ncbi:GNAT family N-acetyltransferase [Rosenbergiella collisarenosi]|uniref:GNAT family N-acetyltransferase n=1 Tax=Rosenbergiella collisarenosi TaxID=1544695 RepID=UPI001BD9696C|nr:GNAT family N-acetyltransferase [Rosenbergiella collisarenosi]MBT0722532.1 GNAT family N-acetyltransferase [Rosenbergiella collisarenosi]
MSIDTNFNSVKISYCSPNDYMELIHIFLEMNHHHYGNVVIDEKLMGEYLRDRVLAVGSGTQILKAVLNDTTVGFACVSILYPAPKFSGQMFIKELFVKSGYRSNGIGQKLMAFIAKSAVENQCDRLDWLSVESDPRAQKFYDSLGSDIVTDVVYRRVFGEKLKALAKKD